MVADHMTVHFAVQKAQCSVLILDHAIHALAWAPNVPHTC